MNRFQPTIKPGNRFDLAKSSFSSALRESVLGKFVSSALKGAWHLTRNFVAAAVDDSGVLRKLATEYLKSAVAPESQYRPAYIRTVNQRERR